MLLARAFPEPEWLQNPESVREEFGMDVALRPLAAPYLPAVLAATFAPPGTAEDLLERLTFPELDFRGLYLPRWYQAQTQPMVDFLNYAVYADVIPFESSPLDTKSLASVVTSTSGVGAGGYFGFLVSGGSPVAIITVPLGMIIGGAAAGVGRALEEGLYERVLARIRGGGRE